MSFWPLLAGFADPGCPEWAFWEGIAAVLRVYGLTLAIYGSF